jgi:putative transposase
MPSGLRRFQQSGHLHAVNVNCFRKQSLFDTPEPRETFLAILEETRVRYAFDVVGYVVMPTHVHLLMSEPETHLLSTAVQVVKQRFSRTRVLEEHVWERRYYDFNVFSGQKVEEKLHYIHTNPVTAGLVPAPADWLWSSYRWYALGELGLVQVTAAVNVLGQPR